MRVKGGNDRSAQVSVDGAVTGRFSKNRIKRRARRVRTSARRVVTWGKIGPNSVKVQIVRRVYATGARGGASGRVFRVKVALFGARRLCLGIISNAHLGGDEYAGDPEPLELVAQGLVPGVVVEVQDVVGLERLERDRGNGLGSGAVACEEGLGACVGLNGQFDIFSKSRRYPALFSSALVFGFEWIF